MSEKTEEPTPKRLEKARDDGDSGASAFASQALAFLVALALVVPAARAAAAWGAAALREAIARASTGGVDAGAGAATAAWTVVALSAPPLLAAAAAAAAASIVQAGGGIAPKRVAPKLERLDVAAGLASLFTAQRAFAVARALVAAAAVGYLAYQGLRDRMPDVAHLAGRVGPAGIVAADVARRIAVRAALVGLSLAAADVVVTRAAWRRRLRMTKDEVRREHKESEGDPQVKAARERAHHELLAAATIGNVRRATVVIVNPTHVACAVRYDEDEGDEAPVVVASGEGDLAAQIVRAARDYGVPVVHDVPLARALRELDTGAPIPEALYEAMAEILRTIWEERGEGGGDGR